MKDEKNWGAEPWRAPEVSKGDELIFSECGRILDHIDYRSHYFRVVKAEIGGYRLLVKHGGGQEEFGIGHGKRIVTALLVLDSDTRYFTLHEIYRVHVEAGRSAAETTAQKYREAFVNGTLVKRKIRGRDGYKVFFKSAGSVSH